MGAACTRALFSHPRFSEAILLQITFHQWAFGDSLPSEAFTNGDQAELKKKQKGGEDLPLSPQAKQLQISKGCRRPCQKGREWTLLICQPGLLCRAQPIRKNQMHSYFLHVQGYTAQARSMLLCSCSPAVCADASLWKNKDFWEAQMCIHAFNQLLR